MAASERTAPVTTDTVTPGPVTAQDAIDARQRDPRAAIAIARRVLATTSAEHDAGERSTAERAIGLSLRELNDLPAALRHLRRAVRLAEQGGLPGVAALARMSLGYVLANAGRGAAGLREVTAALAALTGRDAGLARMQRGLVLHFAGRFDEAVRDYGAAVEIAQQEGDLILEARARNNRGVLRGYRGRRSGSDDDFGRAAEIFDTLGLDLAAADLRWNVGIAAARRGAVVPALRIFAEVEREYRRLEVPRPALLLDRLELLLSVPLIDEAATMAASAVRELQRRRMASDLAEALLAQARVALLAGDLDTASAAAARARGLFRRQGRRPWVALARHVELRAEFRRGGRSGGLLAAMVRGAAQLDETGWPGPALATRIDAAFVARDTGRPALARALVTAASRARRGGTASRRAQGWYATALLRRLDGDERGAAAALRRGLAVLDSYRASLGATDLRASSGAHGEELAREGLDIAVASGRPARVLAWAELWRANALRMAPVSPPRDEPMAEALAELRMVSSALEDALLAGRPADLLRRRQAGIEARIQELARQVDGGGPVEPPPSVRALAAALGDTVLVELVAHGGRILAVVVGDGRATLHDLGALDDALRQVRLHRFGLRRLVTLGDAAAARAAVDHAEARLDSQLFGPLRRRIGYRPLVIVPIGALHALAWSALPTCAGRPVTVVPSASVWLRAARGRPPTGAPVLVAGPRLPAADDEVNALAGALPGARVLTGADATAQKVTATLDGASLAHIAAHGVFRADNPLLSTLELADGPLTAYELEGLRRPPGGMVLSACESGLSGVRPGDELMGFAAVLLGMGTRTLVASVLPVPAERTTTLMLDLHRELRTARGPAAALAAAQRAFTDGSDGVDHATAAAFVCIGAG